MMLGQFNKALSNLYDLVFPQWAVVLWPFFAACCLSSVQGTTLSPCLMTTLLVCPSLLW